MLHVLLINHTITLSEIKEKYFCKLQCLTVPSVYTNIERLTKSFCWGGINPTDFVNESCRPNSSARSVKNKGDIFNKVVKDRAV